MKVVDHNRIAMMIPTLQAGGAERTFLTLANGFQEAGYQVDLILKKNIGEFADLVPQGVNLIDLDAPRMAATVPGLVRYLRKYHPKVLLAGLELPGLVGVMAKNIARSRTRVLISIRTLLSMNEGAFLYNRSLERILLTTFFPHADEIITSSKDAAQDASDYLGIPQTQIRLIYNPVITPAIIENAQQQLNHPWFASGEPPVILGVGRLVPAKDYATLIRAFQRVRQTLPARLIILGEGGERAELEALTYQLGLVDHIQLPGFTPNPYPYLKRAAVFAHSSEQESFGNVLVEAMACGCPVVSTNCPGGPAEITRSGEYAYLVPVGDEEAMAVAILHTLTGEKKRPPPEWLIQFEYKHVVQQYLELFDPL